MPCFAGKESFGGGYLETEPSFWRQSPVYRRRRNETVPAVFFCAAENFAPMEYFVSVRQKLSFSVKTEPAADQERGNEICL